MDYTLKQAFDYGIRAASRTPTNAQALVSASNLRALAGYGLVDFVDVTQPITNAALTSASITKTWPRPQLFRGKGVTLLADATAIFTVTESDSGNWTVTPITVYDWTTYDYDTDTASSDTITSGQSWQFLDLWAECWMLFNGTGVIFKTGFSSKVFYQEAVTIKCGASYQDARVFYGGFTAANTYALTDWATYWATFNTKFPGDFTAKTLSAGMGPNMVWWGNVGMDDMWWLFDRDFMVNGTLSATALGNYGADRPFWKDVWGKRQDGAMPMPWTGSVLGMAQLGQHMMVYGSNGISALSPVDTSFGLGQIGGLSGNVGVMAKGTAKAAFGGDELVQCFLDETGDINIIDGNLRVENLECRQLFSGMAAPLVSFDPQLREFWIGENDNMYTLTGVGSGKPRGLSRAPMAPTTLYFGRSNNASGSVGITFPNSSEVPSFESEWFDAGGQDEVAQVASITLVGAGTWSLGVKYRRYPGDSEQSSGVVLLDGGNSVEVDFSGTAFKVYGTATDRATAKVSEVRLEMTDGTRRSVYAWLQ
jgi:hypothetical protein